MRVLVHSPAPFWPGGYGVIAAQIAKIFVEQKHEVFFSVMAGLGGAPLKWEGMQLLPHFGSQWGNESLPEHVRWWKPDLVIIVFDCWVFDADMLKNIVSEIPVVAYVPIDHEPLPKLFFNNLSRCTVVTYSKWGQQVLAKSGIYSEYIPHGLDLKIFNPEARAAGRKAMKIQDDEFLVGMVALNSNEGGRSRKRHDLVLQEFALFHQAHPKSKLYMHCNVTGQENGSDLLALAEALGLRGQDILRYPDPYEIRAGLIGYESMAKRYAAMDVLVNPSEREGFGLPSLEAQACGTPVIVANNTAQTEMCGSGWLLPSEPLWSIIGGWTGSVPAGALEKPLELAHAVWKNMPQEWAKLRANAVAFAQDFDVEKIRVRWANYLKGVGL